MHLSPSHQYLQEQCYQHFKVQPVHVLTSKPNAIVLQNGKCLLHVHAYS